MTTPAQIITPAAPCGLQERGIAAAAEAMGWQSGTAQGITGWIYTVDDGTSKRQRIKNADRNAAAGKKYVWLGDSTAPKYYFHPTLAAAIDEADGSLIIANGEPGVLTFHEAGCFNVLCFFGEGSLPLDLTDRLISWNVKRVMYYPDRDEAGLSAAVKLRRRLTAAGIDFDCRQLPDTLPTKGDTNDLWQLVQFDPARFLETLDSLPAALLPAEDKPSRLPSTYSHLSTEFPPDFLTAVNRHVESLDGFKRWDRNGWANFQSPFRDDACASAGYNRISFGYNDFAGESMGVIEFARRLGIEITDYRPRIPRKRLPRQRTTAAPGNKPPAPLLAARVKPVQAAPFEATMATSLRYISDIDVELLLQQAAVLIKSPIGTGKTELITRLVDAIEARAGQSISVLVLTHRQALAKNLSKRLSFECYKSIDTPQLRSVPKLVMSYDSVWKLVSAGAGLPRYDIVIIDELEQFQRHLNGGTFQSGEAERAYKVLRQLVIETPLFIGLDAHLTDTSSKWVSSLKPNKPITTLHNAYTPQRGDMTIHASSDAVISTALALANEGTVVIPTNSITLAKTLNEFFKGKLGADNVYMICSDNSESNEAQAFIENINERLALLKVFIYTPSLGTGVDITAETRAVCGVFQGDHMGATDLMQMVGRSRNCAESHIYIRPMEGTRTIVWQDIFALFEQRALSTGLDCRFDAHGIYGISDIQKSMLKLIAMLEADSNQSKNDLLSHFVALAEGYKLAFSETDNPALRAEMKAVAEKVKAEKRAAILASEPVDYPALELHRISGTLTDEVRAGHERFRMEDTVGLELTESLYEQLATPKKREAVRSFTDLCLPLEELREADRHEAKQGHLLSKRKHRTRRRALVRQALLDVFGRAGIANTDEMTAEQIGGFISNFLELHTEDLRRFFNFRNDQSQKPEHILRWILKKVGIVLGSRQVMREGKRYMVYSIDRPAVQSMAVLATARLAHLELKKGEREAITKNVDKYKTTPDLVAPPDWVKPMPGWTYRPEMSDVPTAQARA